MILLQLFISFLRVGAFSVGGGYAAMPLIQNEVITVHPWLTQSEFTDLVTIAEMTPGPIAINASTFVGMRVAGLPGMLVATLGCVTAPILIVTFLSYIYRHYREISFFQNVLAALRPAVVGLIASAALSIIKTAFWSDAPVALTGINWASVGLFIGAIIVLRKFKWSPILTMVTCGVLYTVMSLLGLF